MSLCACGKHAGPTGLCADCFLNRDPRQGSLARPSCSTFVVTGYALIPVEIRIEVSARDESEAGQHAEEFFNNAAPATRRGFIVPNSEDDTSVSEFRWSMAERKNAEAER